MKVMELKKLLEKYHDDDVVVMSKDSEGNDFSPLDEIGESVYEPETTWHGEIHLRELTDELRKQGYCEDDLCHSEDGVNAIVLWPIN